MNMRSLIDSWPREQPQDELYPYSYRNIYIAKLIDITYTVEYSLAGSLFISILDKLFLILLQQQAISLGCYTVTDIKLISIRPSLLTYFIFASLDVAHLPFFLSFPFLLRPGEEANHMALGVKRKFALGASDVILDLILLEVNSPGNQSRLILDFLYGQDNSCLF